MRSVGFRFALVGLAGELATEAALTGWAPGDAAKAAQTCFKAWLTERGTVGAREDQLAVSQLRNFILAHAASRCAVWEEPAAPDPARQAEDDNAVPKMDRFRPPKQIGWRRLEPNEGKNIWTYYLSPDAMREALAGLDFRASLHILVERGFLSIGTDGKSVRSLTPPGQTLM